MSSFFLSSSRTSRVGLVIFQLLYRLRDLMILHLSSDQFFVYENIFSQIEEAYTKVRSIPDGMMLIEITLLVISKWWKKEVRTEIIKDPPPVLRTELKKPEMKNPPKEELITQKIRTKTAYA